MGLVGEVAKAARMASEGAEETSQAQFPTGYVEGFFSKRVRGMTMTSIKILLGGSWYLLSKYSCT